MKLDKIINIIKHWVNKKDLMKIEPFLNELKRNYNWLELDDFEENKLIYIYIKDWSKYFWTIKLTPLLKYKCALTKLKKDIWTNFVTLLQIWNIIDIKLFINNKYIPWVYRIKY